MRFPLWVAAIFLLFTSFTKRPKSLFSVQEAQIHYAQLQAHRGPNPSWTCFAFGIQGYLKLENEGQIHQPYLTLIDFSLPSTQKRLWVIDMKQHKILAHTYISHGMNSGLVQPTDFSNEEGSLKSSLGFYLTSTIYFGKHGLSLKLKGLEAGFNDHAEERAIVMHGATYVSKKHIQQFNRLGRSQGCPALAPKDANRIIPMIKDQSCLFIYAPKKDYIEQSSFIAEQSI
jgi:hypothetical protein